MRESISKKTARDVKEILFNVDKVEILGDGRYRIPSQSVEGKMYTTVAGDEAEDCDCPWHRKKVQTCKHILSARLFNMMEAIAKGIFPGEEDPDRVGPQKGTELSANLPDRCPGCLSTEYHKWGRRGTGRKGKVQKYKCCGCGRQFTADAPSHKLAVSTETLARIVGTYFDCQSYQETSDHMKREGINVSPSTVGNYVKRVVDACLEIFQTLCPAVSDMWSIDDLHVTVKNSLKKYFYCIMDHGGRLMLALREFKTKGASDLKVLFRDAKEVAGGIPLVLLSDADASIKKGARETLRQRRGGVAKSTFHEPGAHIRGERTNNRQEQLERILARWARRFGFVCAADNNRTRGMLIQYNFCRTHSAIGCTPAENSGLVIGGDNPWETLYKHAVWDRIERGVASTPKPKKPKKGQKPRKSRKKPQKRSAEKCSKLTKWITGKVPAARRSRRRKPRAVCA